MALDLTKRDAPQMLDLTKRDASDIGLMLALLSFTPTHTRREMKLQCCECGKSFSRTITSASMEIECPKCGSYDVDLGDGPLTPWASWWLRAANEEAESEQE